MSRVARLAAGLNEPLLVTDGVNVRYLLGFESSNCAVLVEPEARDDPLHRLPLPRGCAAPSQGVEVVQTRRDVASALAELLAGRRIGFEASRISYAAMGDDRRPEAPISSRPAGSSRRWGGQGRRRDRRHPSCRGVLGRRLRSARRASGFSGAPRELAWWIERTFRELGADALASSRSSLRRERRPAHARRGHVIAEGPLVTVDMGCVVDGYCSDCTRTFAAGTLSAQLVEAYELVAQAQLDGLAAVRAGAAASTSTRHREPPSTRREWPTCTAWSRTRPWHGGSRGAGASTRVHLRARGRANVVTFEPGLYLPDVGGCRIEDLVAVTADGCEIMTHFTKGLLVVT